MKRVVTLPELEQSSLMNTQTPQSLAAKSIRIKPNTGSANLNQSEIFALEKQKNLKQQLRNNLMSADLKETKTIGVDKLKLEMELLGIKFAPADLEAFVYLFEDKNYYNKIRNVPEVNYEQCLRHLVPVLSKNSDKASENTFPNYRISWTLSKAAKIKLL